MERADMTKNRNDVPLKQWRKWSVPARRTFNSLFETMRDNKKLFLHPKHPKVSDEHWRTTCWNSAWMAAEAVQGKI
jgi:hypothetical protein